MRYMIARGLLDELEASVNRLMEQGWCPTGGPFATGEREIGFDDYRGGRECDDGPIFAQALWREKEIANANN